MKRNSIKIDRLVKVPGVRLLGNDSANPGEVVALTVAEVEAMGIGGSGSGQPLDATLTALAALDSSAGVVYQTGADTFAKQTYAEVAAAAAVRATVLVTPGPMAVATDTLVPDAARATFVGYAWKDVAALASTTARWRVTTGGGAYSTGWAEMAIAKGAVVPGGAPTLTVVGTASIQASIQAGAAAYNTTISVASGQSIARGDGLWLMWATDGGLSPALGALAADAVQHGFYAYLTTADWRPSSNVGSAVAWTLSPATSTNAEGIRGALFL